MFGCFVVYKMLSDNASWAVERADKRVVAPRGQKLAGRPKQKDTLHFHCHHTSLGAHTPGQTITQPRRRALLQYFELGKLVPTQV